ncbi:MAG TPA: penicillin acylase family protein [Polyangiaceae bacterium]|nr:penicillin acylase family protein [Polyangiaceae bacterium]
MCASLTACGDGDEAKPVGSGPVEIVVDDLGVPHIYAETDEDLFFAYGYQLATDRLLQIEMWRRFAFGRRAEILGADFKGSFGSTALEDDKLVRMFNLPHYGALDAALMKKQHPERYALVQAWRAGINRRVAEVRAGEVPPPFGFGKEDLDFLPEAWDEDDPFIVQKMIQLGLDQTLLFEILVTLLGQLAPDALDSIQLFKPARETQIVPAAEVPQKSAAWSTGLATPTLASAELLASAPRQAAKRPSKSGPAGLGDPERWGRLFAAPKAGSNSWAVDGRFTESGAPMVAGDPHLVFTLMGAMYAVHLNSKDGGGSFDVAGFAFAPAPGIFAGQTRGVVFTPTSAFGDVMDLWAVERDADRVRVNGSWVDLQEREEIIEVRSGSAESITLYDVPGHGVLFDPSFAGVPVPLSPDGRPVMIGWTGFKERSSLYFLELNRAETVEEFDEAVERIPEMSYNWVGADKSSIAYRVSLEVPQRAPIAPGREPWRVMDGNDAKSAWLSGSLSLEQLPHTRAKERGIIVTANNDPFGFTKDGDAANDPFYYGAFFDPGYRAARIDEELTRLSGAGKITLSDMQALQIDARCLMADDFLPLLQQAWSKVGVDPTLSAYENRPELAQLVTLLTQDWDRRMVRDSAGAVAFHAFAHFTAGRALEDDIFAILYERVLEAAPFYLLKIAALALSGAYPNGDKILQEGRDAIVLSALSDTAKLLTDRFGSVDPAGYTWGQMHVTNLDNAYGLGVALTTVPSDGGENTVNVAHSVFRKDLKIPEQWVSDYGPVERMVGQFLPDGSPEIWVNFPMGNIADRASPHFDDRTSDWAEGRYKKFAFRRADVEARAEQRRELRR